MEDRVSCRWWKITDMCSDERLPLNALLPLAVREKALAG